MLHKKLLTEMLCSGLYKPRNVSDLENFLKPSRSQQRIFLSYCLPDGLLTRFFTFRYFFLF